MANILTDPPFAADPPIKVNIPAKTVGIVAAILGILGLIFFGLFGLFAAFALTTLATVCNGLTDCSTGGIFFLALVGVIVTLVGSLLYLVYTRSQVPNVSLAPGEEATLDLGAARRAPAADVIILKVSYWWG